jgi:hypothetical protein
VSGKGSGYLNSWGYLAVKRANIKSDSLLFGDSIILDINATKKSNREDIPEKYVAIDRLFGNANPYATNDTIFIMQSVNAMGLCNLSYQASLLDRIPVKDYKHISLPEDALPAFMFPQGLRLELRDRNEYPLPSFFTFVFTDQDGKHMYVACLKFYEEVKKDDLLPAFQQIWGNDSTFDIPEEKGIFCPKLICVLSRVPFYRAMRRYLRQLYSISLSSSICPLEHFIGAVVGQLPIPVEGGRPFHLVLDAALISPTSRPMTSIAFEVPSERFFPIMDLDFAGPLRSFSVDVLICIYALMLREAKIVFVSKSNALLTETMETLRMLLFPLQWASCFVSRLPPSLVGLLQAPGGFMIGIHLDDSIVGKNIHGPQGPDISRRYIESMHLQYPLLKGTYVVDLVANSLHQFNGKFVEACSNLDHISKMLPAAPKLRLRAKLLKIADQFRIGPQLDEIEEVDSAFDFQSQSMSDLPPREWSKFPTLTVRDAFMSFMADLLGDYTAFIIPPVEDLSADTYRTFREEFMVDEYLSHADTQCRPVLELLMETQMFSVLLQSRSEGTSQALVFFEEASRLQQQLGLGLTVSSLVHNGHGGTTVVPITASQTSSRHSAPGQAHGVAELPLALYKLLECEHRWSCLSKAVQQQTLQRATAQHTPSTGSSTLTLAASNAAAPKALNLTYLSNTSMSTLRSSNHGISSFQQPIQNQKLQDLLQFIYFAHLDESKDSDALSSNAYVIARRELDRDEDVHLHLASFGPLMVPGPTLNCQMELPFTPRSEDDNDGDYEHEGRPVFCYKKGWPILDKELINSAHEFLHRRIKELRKERLFMLNKVNALVKLLVRNPAERLFSDINSSHQHQLQQQSQYNFGGMLSSSTTSTASLAPKNHVSMSMMSAILTTMSTVITTLSLRVKNGTRPLADMLQILGMLAIIDCWGLSDHISETTWRSVLVACGAYGGDSMRRISALVFKTMQSTGLVPNALTYGQYTKAITAKREVAADASDVGNELDAFYFLEEIGFCWYSHKVQESFAVSRRDNDMTAASTPASSSTRRRKREAPKVVIASLLAHDVYVHDLEETLRLKRTGGTVVMFQPKSAAGFAPPQSVLDVREDDKEHASAPVFDYLHKRSKKIFDLAQKLQRRHSHFSTKSRQSSFTLGTARATSSSSGTNGLSLNSPSFPESGHVNGKSSMFSQVTQDLSRSPMNIISKMGGSFFHREGQQAGNAGKLSPMPPPASASVSVTSLPAAKSTGALSSLLSKGSSLFNAMKSSTQSSQVTTPIPSATVSPVRSTGPPPLAPAPHTPISSTSKFHPNEKMEMIASLAAEDRFDDDDVGESFLDDGRLEATESTTATRLSGTSQSSTERNSESKVKDHNGILNDHDLLTEDVRGILLNEEIAARTPHKSSQYRDSQLSPLAEEDSQIELLEEEKDTKRGSLSTSETENPVDSEEATANDAHDDVEDQTLTLDKVQENILSVLQSHAMKQQVCVGMVCRSVCDCGVSMMFEEIMARWCHGNSIDVHRPANARLSVSKTSFNVDVGILCSHCQKSVSPILQVQKYSLSSDLTESGSGSLSRGWDEAVSMFSPFVLQFEYEELLLKVGELAQNGFWLHCHHPAIYWNLLWYAQRFHVPTGLLYKPYEDDMTNNGNSPRTEERTVVLSRDYFYQSNKRMILSDENVDLQAPVVIGWLPSVVERKILRLFQGLPGDSLDIRDMFPDCSEDDFRVLSDMVVSNLDGSPDGLCTALMHFSRCPSLLTDDAQSLMPSTATNHDEHQHDPKSKEIMKARLLYTRLLILGVHFARVPVYDATKSGLLRDYTKDINFDKIFLDAIKCVMSQQDYVSMGIREEVLTSCATSATSNAVRAMIGVLP